MSTKGKDHYIHTEQAHNVSDPEIVVPEIMKLLNPKSVLDVGCGLGTFVRVFKNHGVEDALGIDGTWVNKDLLFKNIDPSNFHEADLEGEINLNKQFDLAISLEVAEHLNESSADQFVENLVNHADTILFSAAIVNQGGQNHINEQPLNYWVEKFAKHGFKLFDCIRPIFWENEELEWWYKQNMVLFSKKAPPFTTALPESPIKRLVHPDLLQTKIDRINLLEEEIESFYRGEKPFKAYFKGSLYNIFGYKRLEKLFGKG